VSAVPTYVVKRGCDIPTCVAALAPTVESCGTAALSVGENLIKDFTCLSDAVGSVTTVPAGCGGCLGSAGDIVGDVGSSVESALGSIF